METRTEMEARHKRELATLLPFDGYQTFLGLSRYVRGTYYLIHGDSPVLEGLCASDLVKADCSKELFERLEELHE